MFDPTAIARDRGVEYPATVELRCATKKEVAGLDLPTNDIEFTLPDAKATAIEPPDPQDQSSALFRSVAERLLAEPSPLRPCADITLRIDQERSIETSLGTLVIPASPLPGHLTIGRFEMEGYEDPENPAVLVAFDFNDAQGRQLRHANAIPFWMLTPPSGTRCELVPQEPKTEPTLSGLFDSRDDYEYLVAGGPPIKGRFKYTGVKLWLEPVSGFDEVRITLWFHCATDARAERNGDHIGIRTSIPVLPLLFKDAPRVESGSINILEGGRALVWESFLASKHLPETAARLVV